MINGNGPGKSNRRLHRSSYGGAKMERINISPIAALQESIRGYKWIPPVCRFQKLDPRIHKGPHRTLYGVTFKIVNSQIKVMANNKHVS